MRGERGEKAERAERAERVERVRCVGHKPMSNVTKDIYRDPVNECKVRE